MSGERRRLHAAILDVDGVVWIAGAPARHSAELLNFFRGQGMPFCLLTNDCSVPKACRHLTLTNAGISIRPEELVTAPEVTREWLTEAKVNSMMYLGIPNVLPDLGRGISVRERGPVDAVVVGDLFDYYDRHAADNAAKAVVEGAHLVAMNRNRHWSDGTNWYIDNGFWVAAFEYVTGRAAILTGKPSSIAYLTAVKRLEPQPRDLSGIALVSDDIGQDLQGAKSIGLTTVYYGPSRNLPVWVDFHAGNMMTLVSILAGSDND